MDTTAIAEKLNRIPVTLLAAVILGVIGYNYYTFESDSSSPLNQKKMQIQSIQQSIQTSKKKLVDAQAFYQSLDVKREALRTLANQLGQMKGTLSVDLNVADFLKRATTEAIKVGLIVQSIRPESPKERDLYVEQPFVLNFSGVYVQLLVFLERIAKFENIARVDQISIHPSAGQTEKYVMLFGKMTISVFRYKGSKADQIASEQASRKALAPAAKGSKGNTGKGSAGSGGGN